MVLLVTPSFTYRWPCHCFPLLTTPHSTQTYFTPLVAGWNRSHTGRQAGKAGRSSALYFWGRGRPQITYGVGRFQSPPRPKIHTAWWPSLSHTPAQKYIRQGAPSLSPTSAHYIYPHLFNNIHVYIIKKHLQSARRHDIIKNHRANVPKWRMLFNNIYVTAYTLVSFKILFNNITCILLKSVHHLK